MAFRKALSSRFLHNATFAAQYSRTAPILPRPDRPEPSMAQSAHRRISQSAATFDGLPSVPNIPFPVGDDLMKRIRSSLFPEQIHPITTCSPLRSDTEKEEDNEIAANKIKMSVQGARKLLRYSRIEKARAKLRAFPKNFISYSEFTQICREISGGSDEVASALDNSGAVDVIGDVVLLRPEQLAQAIESLIDPQPITDTRRSELKQMDAEKAIIDGKAGTQVRRELWAGLGLAFLQTAAFMRLTFWELSWDVMEPVWFFTTSIYFIMGWACFLRTSKEPSFEGFSKGRFVAKQRRLMRAHNFDLSRFNELKRLSWLDHRNAIMGVVTVIAITGEQIVIFLGQHVEGLYCGFILICVLDGREAYICPLPFSAFRCNERFCYLTKKTSRSDRGRVIKQCQFLYIKGQIRVRLKLLSN